MWIISCFTWIFRGSDSNRLDANALLPPLPGFSCWPFPSPAGHDCPSPPLTPVWHWGWHDPACDEHWDQHRAGLMPRTGTSNRQGRVWAHWTWIMKSQTQKEPEGEVKENRTRPSGMAEMLLQAQPALTWHHWQFHDLHLFSEMLKRRTAQFGHKQQHSFECCPGCI